MQLVPYDPTLPLDVYIESGSPGDVTIRGSVQFPDGSSVLFARADDLSAMPHAEHTYTLNPAPPRGAVIHVVFLIGDNPDNPYKLEVVLRQRDQLCAEPCTPSGTTDDDGAAVERVSVPLS